MKSFQELREDRKVMWQRSVEDIIFGINNMGMSNSSHTWPMFPLTKKVENIFAPMGRRWAYHTTDFAGAEHVIGMAATKGKHLSVSTDFEPWHRGIQTKGNVGMLLNGTVMAQSPHDIMSTPDNSGIRWISLIDFSHDDPDVDDVFSDDNDGDSAEEKNKYFDRLSSVFRKKMLKNFFPAFYKDVAHLADTDISYEMALEDSFINVQNGMFNPTPGFIEESFTVHDFLEAIATKEPDHFFIGQIHKVIFGAESRKFRRIVEKYIQLYIQTAEKVLVSSGDRISDLMQDTHMQGRDGNRYNEAIIDDYDVEQVIIFHPFVENNEVHDDNLVAFSPLQKYRSGESKFISVLKTSGIEWKIIDNDEDWDEEYESIMDTLKA